MSKFVDYLDKNVYKIILTAFIMLGIFYGSLYVYTIKRDISYLNTEVVEQKQNTNKVAAITFKGLLIIVKQLETITQQLENIAQQSQYIIDQNHKTSPQISKDFLTSVIKPTYDELKDHTVYIVGCSNKVLSNEKKIKYLLEDGDGKEEPKGTCWAGTGIVVKETDTDTYILTNNHVSGKGEENVTLYVQDNETKVTADIIKQHETVDIAVIHVARKLEGKVAIKKINSIAIQDPIYIVGHPLGVKYIYTEGVMAGYTDVSLLIQAPCIFGNSGSGIYNSKGELVGVVYALQQYPGFLGIPMPQITHTLAVDSVSIKPFLKDLGLYEE